jgi:hypothetical protein
VFESELGSTENAGAFHCKFHGVHLMLDGSSDGWRVAEEYGNGGGGNVGRGPLGSSRVTLTSHRA